MAYLVMFMCQVFGLALAVIVAFVVGDSFETRLACGVIVLGSINWLVWDVFKLKGTDGSRNE